MKVLIVSTSDLQGGAAIAAFRLMDALNAREGVSAKMVVRDKRSDSDRVTAVGDKIRNKWNFVTERAQIFVHNRLSRRNLFDVSTATGGVSVTSLEEFREADVIHLHWINQGMLSLKEIERIIDSGKRVVWTMHDMWAFTGICHHAAGCTRYETGCGMCPYLAKPSEGDLSARVFREKQRIYAKGNIHFVACSRWLMELAERSPLTAQGTVRAIPNPINTSDYRPRDKFLVRSQMGIPADKKVVLYAAARASDVRKGVNYLLEASELLCDRQDDLLFLIAGTEGEDIAASLAVPAQVMGYVPSSGMADLYNAADLFVTPSLQENLPNTIMEAMACGTPCVGFDIGGIPEMITHGETGYVAQYKDAVDLAKGIETVLYEWDGETMSANCREFVMNNYSPERVARQYVELYDSII